MASIHAMVYEWAVFEITERVCFNFQEISFPDRIIIGHRTESNGKLEKFYLITRHERFSENYHLNFHVNKIYQVKIQIKKMVE